MSCSNSGGNATTIEPETLPIDIGCVPTSDVTPTDPPANDQLPFVFVTTTGVLWFYDCTTWRNIDQSLCSLNPVDITVLNNACQALNIPVNYEINGQCVEGVTTLQSLSDALRGCLNLPSYQAGDNIFFTTNPDGSVTISSQDPTVVTAGDNVTVTQPNAHTYEVSAEQKSLCGLPVTTTAVVNAATTAHLIGCVDGAEVKVPLDLIPTPTTPVDWSCVPYNPFPPTDPPDDNHPPFQIGCNGGLWVYTCQSQGWVEVLTHPSTDSDPWEPGIVADECREMKLTVYYEIADCPMFREITLGQFADLVMECACIRGGDNVTVTWDDANSCYVISAEQGSICELPRLTEDEVGQANDVVIAACVDGTPSLIPNLPQLRPLIIQADDVTWGECFTLFYNDAEPTFDSRTGHYNTSAGGSPCEFSVTNPTDYPATVVVDGTARCMMWSLNNPNYEIDVDTSVLFALGDKSVIDQIGVVVGTHGKSIGRLHHLNLGNKQIAVHRDSFHKTMSAVTIPIGEEGVIGDSTHWHYFGEVMGSLSQTYVLQPGETKTFSAFWLVRIDKNTWEITANDAHNFYGAIRYKTTFMGVE